MAQPGTANEERLDIMAIGTLKSISSQPPPTTGSAAWTVVTVTTTIKPLVALGNLLLNTEIIPLDR